MVDCIKRSPQIQKSQYSNPLLFHVGIYVICNLKTIPGTYIFYIYNFIYKLLFLMKSHTIIITNIVQSPHLITGYVRRSPA